VSPRNRGRVFMMAKEEVVLFGCGDVGPIHEPVGPYSTLVRDTLASGDIRFAQIERIYATTGTLQAHCSNGYMRVKPEMASLLSDCRFDVVSVASNHCLDWGPDAFLEHLDVIRGRGIQTVGGGRNKEEAHKPVIVERNGVTVAFLAYCSVLHEGYEAKRDRAGAAPLGAETFYDMTEGQPGVPPKVITHPVEEDLEEMVKQIKAAKKIAHCVVLSLHWGIHYIPKMIAQYQRTAAKAAFAAGADLILGHHPHIPKGVEVFGGKVCFYSLGNFIMTSVEPSAEKIRKFKQDYGIYGAKLSTDPAYKYFANGVDGLRSMIAKAVLTKEGVKRVSFLPVYIDRQLRPEVLHRDDPRFREMVDYMNWASDDFDCRFTTAGDEVVVEMASNKS
jgi:poly-gamma-glutamate capsule biosynthesis protein CapA/YwtB (metallophosphatase superfamily)